MIDFSWAIYLAIAAVNGQVWNDTTPQEIQRTGEAAEDKTCISCGSKTQPCCGH